MIFACFCRQLTADDQQENELIDDAEDLQLNADEEYLHSRQVSPCLFHLWMHVVLLQDTLYTSRANLNQVSLNEHEVKHARQQRLKEIEMWSIIRRFISYLVFLSLISTIIYSSREDNSFFQVKHLRRYLVNSRQSDLSFDQVSHSRSRRVFNEHDCVEFRSQR